MMLRTGALVCLLVSSCGFAGAAGVGPGEPPATGGPAAAQATGTLRLSLADALAMGRQRNLDILLSDEALRSAEGAEREARSPLLPDLSVRFSGAREQINLEAYGFPPPAGQSPVVGPFNVADARLYATQTIFDYSAILASRAAQRGRDAARWGRQDARENVAYVCAALYLQAAIGRRRIDDARAQLATAEALYERAMALKQAGTAAGIEVLRAQVQERAQKQRVIFYENEFAKEKLALAQAIGLPLEQPYDLADEAAYSAAPNLDASLAQAFQRRPDLQQLESEIAAAEAARKAEAARRLPVLEFGADYGWIGSSYPLAERTFTLTAGLSIPVFDGGRISARTQQADASLNQLRARRDDLRRRIEMDARSAMLDVQAGDERVQVARGAVDLAQEQLKEAQDRFSAGVVSNLEVAQAQDALAAASDNYLSALYDFGLAKLSLARALGVAETSAAHALGAAS